MAMLAEPRRKQRIGPNPRGKFFIEDEDNKGRIMLVKMGWKTGNGLGVQSQGMSEPIKPKIQMDSKGLGFDKKTDPWVAHNDEFEELLKALNSSAGAEAAEQGPAATTNSNSEDDSNSLLHAGLEKKSKVSRSRIHYHKFVKNKDLSRASSKDMSCIFGKSLNKVENMCPVSNEDEPTAKESEQSATVTSDEMMDVDTELLPDLSKKRKKKKKKRNKEDREDRAVDDELTEAPVLTTPDEAALQLSHQVDAAEEAVTETEHIRKKKRKHKYHDDETHNAVSIHEADPSINEPEDETLDNVDAGKNEEKRKKKKSKKKRDRDNEEVEMEAEVPVADLNAESLNVETDCSAEAKNPVKKKKKRKRTDDCESKEPVHTPSAEEPAAHPSQQELPPKVESFGSMQFINCGSIEDYFKNKKLQMLRRKLENRNNEQNSTLIF